MQFHPGDNSNNRSALLIAGQAEGFQWSPLNLQLFFAINILGRTKSENSALFFRELSFNRKIACLHF